MRELLYVPIVHSVADMGSKAELLKQRFVERFGPERWSDRRALIEELWQGIRERLLAQDLRWEKVRLYQDGLPVCGRELEIVREVAAQGSRNYALVLELIGKGARLEGTEEPALLRREYELTSAVASANDEEFRRLARDAYAEEGPKILKARDEFIGRRIDQTLRDGEVGVLFVGVLHEVDRFLPKDIQVRYLIHRLRLEGGLEP
ncbi:MAG: hypothetical protein HY705_06735 [Gemmatimonadetes bacterium]|nr:hypothetical protein [Gemmatimonadota bacterium]